MPYEVVRKFELAVAAYAGSRFAVAVSSCTNALFLCCKYMNVKWVHIPRYTYPGVPCSVIHAGGKVCFHDEAWSGIYKLRPYEIYDSALRFQRGMYIKDSLYCLSFHIKKHVAIGRGGMILLDNEKIYNWLKRARFDGRGEVSLVEDKISMLGYNLYMTPDQASRGLMMFDYVKDLHSNDIEVETQGYPDLSKVRAYQWRR